MSDAVVICCPRIGERPDGSALSQAGIVGKNDLALDDLFRSDVQLRIADWVTGFAGSMNFVYIHIVLFTVWMLFIEPKPWPTLTLIVSLEAIFLSTFLMTGQNRQAAFQQAKADHDFNEQELELKTNTQLTREIDRLTTELANRLLSKSAGPGSLETTMAGCRAGGP